jgi:uncharacterized protein YecE (DUF72 family)
MWAHPPWVGRFLSAGNRGHELAEYARWCNAVEGNTTFYAVPPERTVTKWATQAPDEFRFAFKVPRHITHELRLRGDDAARALDAFLAAIDPLGDRVGPIQVQLPPSFGPESLTVLGRFAARLSVAHTWVVELRHRAFFDGGPAHRGVDALLGEAGVGRVVLDTRPLYASAPQTDAALDERRTKPSLPVLTDLMGVMPVVRVIGSDDLDGTADGLRAWIPRLVEWIAEGRRPYLFVHQPENLESPALARLLHAEVAERIGDLAPLPTPLPVAPASEVLGQDSLF